MSLQEVQDRIAGAQEKQQGNEQVLSASGDVATSAATRGVSGLTSDLLIGDVQRQGAQYRQGVDQNTDAQVAQVENEKTSAAAEAQSRIANVQSSNPLLTALKIGTAITGFAADRASKAAPVGDTVPGVAIPRPPANTDQVNRGIAQGLRI